jgi:hypothetical protein
MLVRSGTARRLRKAATVLVCGLAFSGALAMEAQTLLWSVSMKTLGWQDPNANLTKNQSSAGKTDFDLGVIFRQQLAVNVVGQVYAGFGIIGQKPVATKTLRVTALDGKSGSVLRQMDFPTPMLDRTAVLAANDGTLLVVAGDRIQRVNSDGATQMSASLPPQSEINPGLWLTESPSDRTLLLKTDEKTFRFIRTDTLATVAECQTKNNEIDELSDDLAISVAETESPHGFDLHMGRFCGRMSLLRTLANDHGSDVRLLDDHNVLEIGLHRVRRVTLKDKTVWSWDASGKTVPEAIYGVAISTSGGRVAFPLVVFHDLPPGPCSDVCPVAQFDATAQRPSCELCNSEPRFETLITGIAVLDAGTGKQVAMIALEHTSGDHLAFALSPDGHRLAIMNGPDLQLWSL